MITLIMSILITSMVFIAPLNAVSLALITNGIVGRPYFSLSVSRGSSTLRIIELLRVILR